MDISTTPVEELSYTALHRELIALTEAIAASSHAAASPTVPALNRSRLLLAESKRREEILHEIFHGKPKEQPDGISSLSTKR